MATAASVGEVLIPNVVGGAVSLRFDGTPEDVAKAQQAIPDLLRRGYVLTVEVNGQHEKVTGYDPAQSVYYIETVGGRKAVPAAQAKATAVPPTTGG